MNRKATRPLSRSSYSALGLWSLSLAYFTMGTASITVVGLINELAADLAVSKPAIAMLVTVFALTFALAAPLIQVAAGRLPSRTLLLGGLSVMALGCLLSGLAPGYPEGAGARVVMALGAAAVGPVAAAVGAGLVPPARQGHALAGVFGGMTLATVLGLPVTTWMGGLLGWRWVFAALAALTLLTALTIALLVSDRRAAPPVSLASFGHVFRHRAAAWAVAMALFHMAAQFSLYALIAPFLQERFGVAPAQLPLALLLGGLSSVAGNLLAGRFGDRLGAPLTLKLSVGGLACAFGSLIVLPAAPWLGIAGFAFWSLIGMTFYAPQQKRLIALAPELRNLLLAMNASALYLGMSLGSAAASQVWQHLGPWSPPAMSLVFLGLALMAFVLSRRAEAGTSATHPPARP